MTIASNLALLDMLRQCRLVSTEQMAVLPQALRGRLTDARALARFLLQKGWLTVYQTNQLLLGHSRDLVVGPYHVLDRLGQGGQSTVFKARHAEDGFVVALKVIRSDLLANAEASRQFLQEMEAMAKLDHANIVQFCDADQAGETYYCAMEYVEGTDLGKYVRLVGPLPVPEACNYIRQAALGLQHAHEHHLIHRDIKPVNLFLTGEPVPQAAEDNPSRLVVGSLVKILDWGLASLRPPKQAEGEVDAPTESRAIVGTADYVSPEQAMNAQAVDIRGDIYSLGCTFYYLLTGQPPFPGGTIMQKLVQHQRAEPTAAQMLRPDLPFGLSAILRRMMGKRPEDRYQTPASVAIALAPFCRTDRVLLSSPLLGARLQIDPAQAATPDHTPLPASLQDHEATMGMGSTSHTGVPLP